MREQEFDNIKEASISHTYLGCQSMQYPLMSATVLEGQIAPQTFWMFGSAKYKKENEEFRVLPIKKKTHDEDKPYPPLFSQAMQTGKINKIVWPVNVEPSRYVDLDTWT